MITAFTTVLPRANEFHFHAVELFPPQLKSRRAYSEAMSGYEVRRAGKKLKCPCPRCFGEGRCYLEESDPVEGRKMQSKSICPRCKGSGEHPDPEAFWAQYGDLRAKALARIAQDKKIRKAQEGIILLLKQSCTPAEIKLAGFHNPRGKK